MRPRDRVVEHMRTHTFPRRHRRGIHWPALLVAALLAAAGCGSDDDGGTSSAVQPALDRLVARADGPPGAMVVVQRGAQVETYTAGVGDLATQAPLAPDEYLRVASVAKAFSGAAALALVSDGTLTLDDTIGKWLPELPASWASITLRQLLGHTSGLVDFSDVPAFREAVAASLDVAPPPIDLLAFVFDEPPSFPPGSRYRYSNSDNIVVGLMIAAATGTSYEDVLHARVSEPLGLTRTSLPAGPELPAPAIHGYLVAPPDAPEDVSELFAAGWAWASGGIVSSPADLTRFVRGYVGGALVDDATRAAQFTFVAGGHSEPPGPGTNAAGLALFRYETRCGTVYGHTGNTAGYTQFIAASEDGSRSVVVSVTAQITPSTNAARFAELRRLYARAVCAALE